MAFEREPIQKGKKILDEVVITIGVQSFDGWQNVSVTKNLESIANQFSISLFDKFEFFKSDWPIKPGVDVKVNINGDRVLTGRIEKLQVDYTNTDRGYVISGRSNPGDLIDCMHVGPAEFKNISLVNLAQKLVDPFGIEVFTSVVPSSIKKFSVKPGETVFEAIDRAARTQGLFFISTRGGNIRLTRASRARASVSLEQGINVLEASATYDDSKRFDQYIVKAQSSGLVDFFGADVSQVEGKAFDGGVNRYRPFTMIAEGNADNAQAKTRAQWEASSRLAQSIRVKATVQGWTQAPGVLWDINQVVPFKSRFLGLNRDMLITSVSHDDSTGAGDTTVLTLVDPQSYTTVPKLNKTFTEDIFADLGANF